MKLVLAIVNNDDSAAVSTNLTKGGFSVTENAEREALSRVTKDGDNGVLYIYRKEGNTAEGDSGPRVNYKFDMSAYDSLTISYKTKTNDAQIYVINTAGTAATQKLRFSLCRYTTMVQSTTDANA